MHYCRAKVIYCPFFARPNAQKVMGRLNTTKKYSERVTIMSAIEDHRKRASRRSLELRGDVAERMRFANAQAGVSCGPASSQHVLISADFH